MRVIIFLVVFALGFGCGDAGTNSENNVNDGANNDTNNGVQDGEALYIQHCQACHGPGAVGTTIWEGSIAGYQPIAGIVKDGRGTMAPVAVTDAETSAIQDYLLSLGPDWSEFNGRELYERQCATCHGTNGEGTEKGYPLQYTFSDYAKWVVRNGREGLEFDNEMPAYPVEQISEEQLDEMIEFLHSGPRPLDGEGLYNMFCANCHGMEALGGFTNKPLGGRFEIEEVVRVGKGGTDYGNRLFYMPGWTPALLNVSDLEAIASYLGALPEP